MSHPNKSHWRLPFSDKTRDSVELLLCNKYRSRFQVWSTLFSLECTCEAFETLRDSHNLILRLQDVMPLLLDPFQTLPRDIHTSSAPGQRILPRSQSQRRVPTALLPSDLCVCIDYLRQL